MLKMSNKVTKCDTCDDPGETSGVSHGMAEAMWKIASIGIIKASHWCISRRTSINKAKDYHSMKHIDHIYARYYIFILFKQIHN